MANDTSAATVGVAVEKFLSSPRCRNPNTRRSYSAVLARLVERVGPDRRLDDLGRDEIATFLDELSADAAASTRNQRRSTVASWLAWCEDNNYLAAEPDAPTKPARPAADHARVRAHRPGTTPTGPSRVDRTAALAGSVIDQPSTNGPAPVILQDPELRSPAADDVLTRPETAGLLTGMSAADVPVPSDVDGPGPDADGPTPMPIAAGLNGRGIALEPATSPTPPEAGETLAAADEPQVGDRREVHPEAPTTVAARHGRAPSIHPVGALRVRRQCEFILRIPHWWGCG